MNTIYEAWKPRMIGMYQLYLITEYTENHAIFADESATGLSAVMHAAKRCKEPATNAVQRGMAYVYRIGGGISASKIREIISKYENDVPSNDALLKYLKIDGNLYKLAEEQFLRYVEKRLVSDNDAVEIASHLGYKYEITDERDWNALLKRKLTQYEKDIKYSEETYGTETIIPRDAYIHIDTGDYRTDIMLEELSRQTRAELGFIISYSQKLEAMGENDESESIIDDF